MASKIKVDQIEGSTGSTITVPTGQTFTITDGIAASTIGSGTLADARLPTITVAKGGTNLTSFTAGDVLYATGSTTLAKLAKGTAGQALLMNSGGTAPEWGTAAGGKIGQVLCSVVSGDVSTANRSYGDINSGFSLAITPSATSSKILWAYNLCVGSGDQYSMLKMVYGDGSDLTTNARGDAASSRTRATTGGIYDAATDVGNFISMMGLDAPNTTSATTYKLQGFLSSGTLYFNRRVSDVDNATYARGISTLTLMEVLA